MCAEGELFKRYTSNIEAYQAYLRGRYFINNQYSDIYTTGPEKTLLKAAGYFQQAIQIDANYAPAYAGLADAYTAIVWFSSADPRLLIAKAKAAALKAVQIDDALAEAHVGLGNVYIHEWNFEAAGREYERAVALNPGGAWPHDGYSNYLMAVSRVDEMLSEVKRAEELDPLNISIVGDRGTALYLARRYDEAIAEFRKIGDITQVYGPSENFGACYLGKGMYDEAINQLEKTRATNTVKGRIPVTVVWLAVGYAMAGRKTEAERLLNEVKEISKKQHVPQTFLAYVYTALGKKEEAFEMLDNAYREHDSNLIVLTTHPWFDPLRSDARFNGLLRRVGLPTEAVR